MLSLTWFKGEGETSASVAAEVQSVLLLDLVWGRERSRRTCALIGGFPHREKAGRVFSSQSWSTENSYLFRGVRACVLGVRVCPGNTRSDVLPAVLVVIENVLSPLPGLYVVDRSPVNSSWGGCYGGVSNQCKGSAQRAADAARYARATKNTTKYEGRRRRGPCLGATSDF